jgi:filamentous hemagglutinin family protein
MNTGFFDRLQRAFVWPVLLLAWLACGFEVRANPTGGSVNPNQATITGQGTPTVNINQTAGSALINWSTFNVGAGETVNFNQPSANSVTWNQINDANPSQILGDINANGYVVLQNANGFYIGGQAVLTTHGLVMTTASTPAINLGAGGPWSFDAPPPAAKIENCGQINITGGGTAYLIASDIVNEKGGSINAPNGQIGLYDGETVLVSTAPNGQGLNAAITLPQGSVDNEGKLTASGGSVVAQAQFVNQNGVIQADTVANVNGTIELLGGSSVTLGANSTISAAGDSTASSASAGGSVQIQGNSFSDASGSSINVSGASQGGNAGSVSISAPQMTALNSSINGQAAAGYLNGALTIDTADIALNPDGSPVSGALGLDVAALSSGLSQINLLASDNITLASGAQWLVGPNGGIPTALSMVAGNEIELQNGSAIQANGQNISLQAATVDLAGMLQADTVGSAAGVINIAAGQNLTLETGSAIDATGIGGIPTQVSLESGNQMTLNSGSVIQANGGNINLNAPLVDQGGTLQANSVGSANGVIEIDASQKLTLEASSTVSANGDSSASSPGGFVVLNAGGLYTDYSGSTISVSGNAGGQGGVVEIFDPQAGSTPLQTAVSGALAWLVNPFDMTLSGNSTGTTYDDNGNLDANFDLSDLAAYLQIDLHALDNIELQAPWTLNGSTGPAVLSLTAGNNIILDGGNGAVPNYGINAGKNWNVNLTAGTGFTPTSAHPTPVSGSAGIYLEANSVGQSYILAQNGNINLWAANEVQVGWVDYAGSGVENPTSGSLNPGASSISTTAGGNISVKTLHGDVNTGSNPNGFTYNATAPYDTVVDTVANLLGGISTAAGGNVAIAAGGNVISYIPSGTTLSTSDAAARDGGTGAFGSLPGNVTITAGGNIYGHFVVADGVGTITAGRDAGLAGTADFALSLISGGWSINAPNGSIYLQEVRNPNGVFNDSAPHGRSGNPGKYFFNYSQDAYVDLTANAVYLTDMNLPRYSSSSPDIPGVLYPPILDINAGSGGVTLEGNITLFPSADQNLNITTTDEGSVSGSGGLADPFELLMSDSAATVWSTGAFLDSDHGALANEPNDSTPVTINVSGNIQDLNLIVDKVAQINVDGDLINSGFSGQNLQASDITSIKVGGVIYSSSPYSSIDLTKLIPEIPAQDLEDLLPGMANSWNAIFALAIDASALNSSTELQTLANTQASQWLTTILENPDISLFQDQQVNGSLTPSIVPNFIYSPTTLRLWYVGPMSSQIAQALENPITILHLVNGQPVIDTNPNDDSPGRTYG